MGTPLGVLRLEDHWVLPSCGGNQTQGLVCAHRELSLAWESLSGTVGELRLPGGDGVSTGGLPSTHQACGRCRWHHSSVSHTVLGLSNSVGTSSVLGER